MLRSFCVFHGLWQIHVLYPLSFLFLFFFSLCWNIYLLTHASVRDALTCVHLLLLSSPCNTLFLQGCRIVLFILCVSFAIPSVLRVFLILYTIKSFFFNWLRSLFSSFFFLFKFPLVIKEYVYFWKIGVHNTVSIIVCGIRTTPV